jgi:hypothetical protein
MGLSSSSVKKGSTYSAGPGKQELPTDREQLDLLDSTKQVSSF